MMGVLEKLLNIICVMIVQSLTDFHTVADDFQSSTKNVSEILREKWKSGTVFVREISLT